MTDILWLSADETLQHVLSHELVPDVARTKLEDRLWRGEIPARAALLRYGGTEASDTVIPFDFWNGQWRDIRIDYAGNAATSRAFSPALRPAASGGGMVADFITNDSAAGLAFSQRHLYLIWPELASAEH
jgi:hypothetical protein